MSATIGNGPVLLFGASGQVGSSLLELLQKNNRREVVVPDRAAADFTTPSGVRDIVRQVAPSLILNAAAYTAVDTAESDKRTAFLVNRDTPYEIASEARRCGAFLVHYSTDYVFDGRADTPYREESPAAPVNVYGESKLAGEVSVASATDNLAIIRTSWVYAAQGRNFLNAMWALAETRQEIRVVCDQTGCPTWAGAIARSTLDALEYLASAADRDPGHFSGIYHLSAAGQTTWADFAVAIFNRISDRPPRVVPISTEEYGLAAERPRYTVLDNQKIRDRFGIRMASWENQLDDCLASVRAD